MKQTRVLRALFLITGIMLLADAVAGSHTDGFLFVAEIVVGAGAIVVRELFAPKIP